MLHALYRGMCTEGGRSRDGCPIGRDSVGSSIQRRAMLHALYRDMCTEGGRGRDGCPMEGTCWAALYRGVPCYMLYTEACAPREAEAVMGAP